MEKDRKLLFFEALGTLAYFAFVSAVWLGMVIVMLHFIIKYW